MTAEDAIAALDDGGENTVAEVRQALLAPARFAGKIKVA